MVLFSPGTMSTLWVADIYGCIAFADHPISGPKVSADHVVGEVLEERLIQWT
jgi:hypothetical protein